MHGSQLLYETRLIDINALLLQNILAVTALDIYVTDF